MGQRLKRHLESTSAKTGIIEMTELYDGKTGNREYLFWQAEDGSMMVWDESSGEWVKTKCAAWRYPA